MNITTNNAFAITDAGTVTVPTTRKDSRELATSSMVTNFGQRDHFSEIFVTIPSCFLKTVNGKEVLPDWKPYEEWFSTELAKRVVPHWKNSSFGIIPGNFFYDRGAFCFAGEPESNMEKVDSLLLYSNVSMKGYAGIHGVTTFRFGRSDYYGIVLPLNSIMQYKTTIELRAMIKNGLKEIFA